MKILMIEDDLAIGQALLSVFQDEGHTAVWLRLAQGAAARMRSESSDSLQPHIDRASPMPDYPGRPLSG